MTVVDLAQLTLLRELIEAMLKAYQQKLFVIHTVHELLWGYKDEILSLVHIFKPDVSPKFGLFYEVSFLPRTCLQHTAGKKRAHKPECILSLPLFQAKTKIAWSSKYFYKACRKIRPWLWRGRE